jgi:hypothetical protein
VIKVEILLRENMSKIGSSESDLKINDSYIILNLAIKKAYGSFIIHKSQFYKTKLWWS